MADNLDLLNYPGSKLGSITNVAPPVLKPTPSKPTPTKPTEIFAETEPVIQQIKSAEEKQKKFEAESSVAEAQAKARQAQGYQTAAEEEVRAIKEDPMRAEFENAIREKRKLAFVPNQENAQDLAAVFSLINVLGFALGKGGKANAQAAMSAMNGMAEGYQKGRADLYKKEKDKFEAATKALDKSIETLYKGMQENAKLAATKKELARQNIDVLVAQEKADFLKTYIDKNGPAAATDYLKKLYDSKVKLAEIKSKEDIEERRAKADAERLKNEQIRLGQGERRLELLEGNKKQLKDKEVSKIEGAESLANSLEKLKQEFKPEYASLGVLGFGSDLSYEAKRRLGTEEGQKAVSWWSKYERLQAPERHSLFGATLTGNELKSYRGMSATKSDNPKIVENMLQDQINYTRDISDSRRLAYESAGYKVPESIKPRDFDKTYDSSSTQQTPTKTVSEEKLKAYADQYFNGDAGKAKKYLATQGYE